MKRQVPRSATVLYAIAGTCAVIGALLWVRSRSSGTAVAVFGSPYGSSFDADSYRSSAWQVWSSQLSEERLGVYLLVAALVLGVVARLVATWRD